MIPRSHATLPAAPAACAERLLCAQADMACREEGLGSQHAANRHRCRLQPAFQGRLRRVHAVEGQRRGQPRVRGLVARARARLRRARCAAVLANALLLSLPRCAVPWSRECSTSESVREVYRESPGSVHSAQRVAAIRCCFFRRAMASAADIAEQKRDVEWRRHARQPGHGGPLR